MPAGGLCANIEARVVGFTAADLLPKTAARDAKINWARGRWGDG